MTRRRARQDGPSLFDELDAGQLPRPQLETEPDVTMRVVHKSSPVERPRRELADQAGIDERVREIKARWEQSTRRAREKLEQGDDRP